jgi:hypothetical protein
MWLWLILAGSWVVSRWLTEQLLKHVLNPLLDDALDRNDGLVILIPALLWAVLFPVLLLLLLGPPPPDELRQTLLVLVGLGLAWGISIGLWLLLTWWSEVDQLQLAYEPVHTLGEPVKLLSSPGSSTDQPPAEMEEIEAELDEIFGRLEEQESV